MRHGSWLVRFAVFGLTLICAWGVQAQSRFVISPDGQEVTDTGTKLVWQRCAVGQKWDGKTCAGKPTKLTLSKAREIGASAATPGLKWRVPKLDELTTLIERKRKKPAIDVAIFPGTPSAIFWALRPEFQDDLNVWLVDFGNGHVFGNTRKASFFVRLVRGA